jgi:alanine dehydrogenase
LLLVQLLELEKVQSEINYLETARVLALRGANVVMASRDMEKMESITKEFKIEMKIIKSPP